MEKSEILEIWQMCLKCMIHFLHLKIMLKIKKLTKLKLN